MTPKEKAEELFLKFRSNCLRKQAIDYSLIVVEEILKLYTEDDVILDYKYWLEVKEELLKL